MVGIRQYYEFFGDLLFLASIFIVLSFIVISGPPPSGIVIPDKQFILESTVVGNINQFNIFNSLIYLPIYYFHLNPKIAFVLVLAISIFIGGLFAMKIFRPILRNITADNTIVMIIPWISITLVLLLPFNLYNLKNLTAFQYVAPAAQMIFMYDVILGIIYFVLRDINYKYLLLIIFSLLLINYQFFYGSILLFLIILSSIFLSYYVIVERLKLMSFLSKILLISVLIIALTVFALYFDINLYPLAHTYTPVLPQLSLQKNTNYHIFLIYQSLPPNFTSYVNNSLNNFNIMWLLTHWILSNYQVGKYALAYTTLVNIIGAIPFFLLLVKNIKKEYMLLIVLYFAWLSTQLLIGPQISMFFAEFPNQYAQIISFVYDAPMVYIPVTQVLISILSPIALGYFISHIRINKIRKKLIIIELGIVFIILILISNLYYNDIPVNSVASSSLNSPSVLGAKEVVNYLSKIDFPPVYFELLNNSYADTIALYTYPESQFNVLDSYNITYLYYIFGYSLLYPGFLGVNSNVYNPYLVNQVLGNFGFKYIVTDQPMLAHLYNYSGYFSIVLKNNYFNILKLNNISSLKNNKVATAYLLTTSAKTFTNFIKNLNEQYNIIWLNAPYLLNISFIQKLIYQGHKIYVAEYFTKYELYTFVTQKIVIIPTLYCANSYYNNQWMTGFFKDPPQETWSQNIHILNNYQYQNDISPNYGLIFTSQNNARLNINSHIPAGSYAIIVRALKSNLGGTLSMIINNYNFSVDTLSKNSSFFQFIYLGNIRINTNTINITIINQSGFNAINVIYIIPLDVFNYYQPIFDNMTSYFEYATA